MSEQQGVGGFSPEVLAELRYRYERLDSEPVYPLHEVLERLGIDVTAATDSPD